jgi:hypothetical protein
VICEKNDHLAAVCRRLTLQPHQQVHAPSDFRAPVGEVPGLNQERVASVPAQLLVDQIGLIQDRGQLLEGTVNVADGDDAPGLDGSASIR